MSSVFTENQEKLLSLGFGFHGKPPKKSADPEQAIVDLLPSFFEDRKLFRMLLVWLDTVSDFIHIERLRPLSKNLSPNLKLVLGALSLKLTPKDRRWKLISERIKLELKDTKLDFNVPDEYKDPFLMKKHGQDKEFAEFGIRVATLAPENPKKIMTLRWILQSNAWLRLRAVMGPNFRADTAYLFVTETAKGPAEAARILQCARDTAYRNWRALEEAEVRSILKLTA